MIPIQNIYYMLSYAFQILQENGYRSVATEEFQNTADLCAAILEKGVSAQIKRGLQREYRPRMEPLANPRGKMEITASLKDQTLRKKQLVCQYDEFSVDSYLNRILKTTMRLLLRADLSGNRKKKLKKLLLYFGEVGELQPASIQWHLRFDRNNQSYQMLIAVCYLVVKGLLQTQADGTVKVMDFLDEQRMCRLYEKFILSFYRKEFPALHAAASQVEWDLDDEENEFLPVMKSDITLSQNGKVLIIDAKYYAHTMQAQYDVHTLHSGNLYQIFTYVKNRDSSYGAEPHEVSGMLLYAKTDEEFLLPAKTYRMSGNKISVQVLDLDCDFEEIRHQLQSIAEEYFG